MATLMSSIWRKEKASIIDRIYSVNNTEYKTYYWKIGKSKYIEC